MKRALLLLGQRIDGCPGSFVRERVSGGQRRAWAIYFSSGPSTGSAASIILHHRQLGDFTP
eukprot:4008166-Lingulodinium_polyedra.AAC.1